MGKIKRMDQIRLILKIYNGCGSLKKTARQLKMSKNTIKNYIKQAGQSNYSIASLLTLDEDDFAAVFNEVASSKTHSVSHDFLSRIPFWVNELKRPGVTRQTLWEEYILQNTEGYSYSRFCGKLKLYLDAKARRFRW
jgi:hypothetical protein